MIGSTKQQTHSSALKPLSEMITYSTKISETSKPIFRRRSRRIARGSEVTTLSNKLKSGDTIQCHDYSEMRDVLNTLSEQGYDATVTVGYTIRIMSVPIQGETEADGFITRTMK